MRVAGPTAPTLAPTEEAAFFRPAIPAAQPRQETEPITKFKPPYLASETAARMSRPIEPWANFFRVMMPILGIVLIGAFAAPWGVGNEGTIFSWTGFDNLSDVDKIARLALVGTGTLAILFGLLPMGTLSRGIAACFIGLFAAFATSLAAVAQVDWLPIIKTLGVILLVSGLLVRSQYKTALIARLLVTLGASAIIVPVIVPTSQGIPLVALLEQLTSGSGDLAMFAAVQVLPIALAGICLLAWIPAPSSAGARPLAWVWILWAVITAGTMLILRGGDIVTNFKGAIHVHLWTPIASTAWTAMIGYGLATIIGKRLERY